MRQPDRHPQHCMDDACIRAWETMCVVSFDDGDICGFRSCETEKWDHDCDHRIEFALKDADWPHVTFIEILAA